MSQITPVFKREFFGYFRSPVAYVFLIVFLVASVGLAFFLGNFFKANQASLESYFFWHPWLFVLLIPAAGMRLWSEEKRTGTVELLFTLPITTLQAVLGKFFAACWVAKGRLDEGSPGLPAPLPMPFFCTFFASGGGGVWV